MAPDRPDAQGEATVTHVDEGPWQRVRAQRHPDGSERFVSDRWFVIGRDPQYMSLLSRWDPGVVVHRHGHWGHQVIYVTRGEVTIGDRTHGVGTHIDLPVGAAIGPMIAGPDGVDMLEVTWGDPRSWEADREEFAQVLADHGIDPLPNPPIDLPPWLEDRRSEHAPPTRVLDSEDRPSEGSTANGDEQRGGPA
ncbi:MAG TPA: hypothetical protein VMU14_22200 [Acidimicrobiales bacterium]|nr:hypothetical protein [Acidimicrobiales bacterium]